MHEVIEYYRRHPWQAGGEMLVMILAFPAVSIGLMVILYALGGR